MNQHLFPPFASLEEQAKAFSTMQQQIEQRWLERVRTQELKPGSAKYAKAELEFFCGAMATLEAIYPGASGNISTSIPAAWCVNAMSGRPLVASK